MKLEEAKSIHYRNQIAIMKALKGDHSEIDKQLLETAELLAPQSQEMGYEGDIQEEGSQTSETKSEVENE